MPVITWSRRIRGRFGPVSQKHNEQIHASNNYPTRIIFVSQKTTSWFAYLLEVTRAAAGPVVGHDHPAD
jgi:hypothetical protein